MLGRRIFSNNTDQGNIVIVLCEPEACCMEKKNVVVLVPKAVDSVR